MLRTIQHLIHWFLNMFHDSHPAPLSFGTYYWCGSVCQWETTNDVLFFWCKCHFNALPSRTPLIGCAIYHGLGGKTIKTFLLHLCVYLVLKVFVGILGVKEHVYLTMKANERACSRSPQGHCHYSHRGSPLTMVRDIATATMGGHHWRLPWSSDVTRPFYFVEIDGMQFLCLVSCLCVPTLQLKDSIGEEMSGSDCKS